MSESGSPSKNALLSGGTHSSLAQEYIDLIAPEHEARMAEPLTAGDEAVRMDPDLDEEAQIGSPSKAPTPDGKKDRSMPPPLDRAFVATGASATTLEQCMQLQFTDRRDWLRALLNVMLEGDMFAAGFVLAEYPLGNGADKFAEDKIVEYAAEKGKVTIRRMLTQLDEGVDVDVIEGKLAKAKRD